MQEYVLGFRFSPDLQWAVLIQKLAPKWQLGKLNGVGGKIEPNESAIQAMVREFEEETGLKTKQNDWSHGLTMEKENEFRVYIFISVGDVIKCYTKTKEEVYLARVSNLPQNIIPNLKWIIPMLLDPELALPITIPFIQGK